VWTRLATLSESVSIHVFSSNADVSLLWPTQTLHATSSATHHMAAPHCVPKRLLDAPMGTWS
jgi:hypothetical protein